MVSSVDTQREDLMGGLGCKLPYGGTELLKTRWPVGSTMATTFSSFCVEGAHFWHTYMGGCNDVLLVLIWGFKCTFSCS